MDSVSLPLPQSRTASAVRSRTAAGQRLPFYTAMVLAFASLCSPAATAAAPSSSPAPALPATAAAVGSFYESRRDRSLWFAATSGDAATVLLSLLRTAEVDGLSQGRFGVGQIEIAIHNGRKGGERERAAAEQMLSRAFVDFAQALQRDPQVGIFYVDSDLKPKPQSASRLLEAAAGASSLSEFLSKLGWMNPIYARLRESLVNRTFTTERQRQILAANLERARALPPPSGRHVIVNAANQRLYMYENEKVIGEMPVVVGRPDAQTPLINAFIRFAVVNPYWNVPSDITARRLAPVVLKRGQSYLQARGYEIVSDFTAEARPIDASAVDWPSVAAGQTPVNLRQLPGPANSMGQIKFMFPNSQGIWLHDTPEKDLFNKSSRYLSNGCVRVAEPWRLARWLLKRPVDPSRFGHEEEVKLPEPVPIFVTYLTVVPSGTSLHYFSDTYRRDAPPLLIARAAGSLTPQAAPSN